MQKSSLGRIVLVTVDPKTNNGSSEAPAVIVRAWSDTLINARVLLDGSDVTWMTSISLFQTREDLEAERQRRADNWAEVGGGSPTPPFHAAYWPPRV